MRFDLPKAKPDHHAPLNLLKNFQSNLFNQPWYNVPSVIGFFHLSLRHSNWITKSAITTVILLSAMGMLKAQSSSLRCQVLETKQELLLTERNCIDPASIQLTSTQVNGRSISFVYDSLHRILRLNESFVGDSIQLCYRVFPFYQGQRKFLYDTSIRQFALAPEYARQMQQSTTQTDWWETPGIQYSGSFTRGLSGGNNQSLLLNSNLNLQLRGDLGQGISIEGAISDQQIPIQPEGNTRLIQEFDRLYLRVSKSNQQLTAGDFEVGKPTGYFMNYFKKNKGGLLETQWKWKGWDTKNKTAFAVSKGKTNRMQLVIQNGNQGPYRLQGAEGEAFIIVLAGSEKVYLDGQLLERGENSDYVMDYNLAELRFMPSRLVTDQSRIIIDFEYLVQSYTRSLWLHQTAVQNKHWNVYLNLFNEKDSKEPAITSDLDSLDRSLLANAGDSLDQAIRAGIRTASIDFNINRIYYRQRDTSVLSGGQMVQLTYLVHDPEADSTALQVQFSEVGSGRGSYVLQQSSANGRVYAWIAPDPVNGQLRGQYEPVVRLIAPSNQWMLNGGLTYHANNGMEVAFESAYSAWDPNRISNLDDYDNRGWAMKIKAQSPPIQLLDSALQLRAGASYEWVHHQFKPLLSFRNVEFDRDWSLTGKTVGTDRQPSGFASLDLWNRFRLFYQFSELFRGQDYKGTRQQGEGRWNGKRTTVSMAWHEVSSHDGNQMAVFSRPKLEWKSSLDKDWNIEFQLGRERNSVHMLNSDHLLLSSFSFDASQLKLTKKFGRQHVISMTTKWRKDLQVQTQGFEAFSNAYELGIEALIRNSKTGQWDFKFTGRNLKYSDARLRDSLPTLQFISVLDHQIRWFNQCISMKNYYELQSGSEPRQEFVFEERKPGDGHYIYIDFNRDGIRQQFEYVYAPDIDTARFERYQLFNSTYYQVYQASWNQNLQIDFSRNKTGKEVLKDFLRSFSLESAIRFSSKLNEDSEWSNRFNPLYFLTHAQQSLAFTSSIRQSLYFNRSHPVFEGQLGWVETRQKVLLTSGEDEKSVRDPFVKFRYTFHSNMDFGLALHFKTEQRNSTFFAEQNYQTRQWILAPNAIYRAHQNLRLFANAKFANVEDQITGSALTSWWEAEVGFATFLQKKITLRGQLLYAGVDFQGNQNSLVAYNLLQGFRDGGNHSGELLLEYKISSLIQIQFSYHVRKAAGDDALHTGRAQLRAHF